MKRYIKSINALNDLTLTMKSSDEIERYAESDIFWAASKKKSMPRRVVKKGEIYQFEFGKNFAPEMSYEHRGLIIGSSGNLLYVLPIYSYSENVPDHRNAIHLVDNPAGKSNLFLLKACEFSFLTHDSVLKLSDLRSVSIARIKYHQKNGYIPPDSDTYKAIEQYAFSRHFPTYSYKFRQLEAQNIALKEELEKERVSNIDLQSKMDTVKDILGRAGTDEERLHLLQKILDE